MTSEAVVRSEETGESRLARANAPEAWDVLWKKEGQESWRKDALAAVYDRIIALLPKKTKRLVDVGGGVGIFARQALASGRVGHVLVVEPSGEGVHACAQAGESRLTAMQASAADLRAGFFVGGDDKPGERVHDVLVATEVLEHLSDEELHHLLCVAPPQAFFSVPNDRLYPDEEPQHARGFTAISLKRLLWRYYTDVRVEVLGPPAERGQPAFLLAVCGFPKPQSKEREDAGRVFSLAMTMPVRDEGADIEKVLASFSGFVDEIVIGVDPRTKDNTWQIAEKYADIVFALTELRGPPGEEVLAPDGFHFAHARNQCIRRCTASWIFMTEGHERLKTGQDTLLSLGELMPEVAQVGLVFRTSFNERWGYPWIFRNKPDTIYYTRASHNDLHFPEKAYVVRLPQISTLHDRDHAREQSRNVQRSSQNRRVLMEDWLTNKNALSLHYLGSEWRLTDERRAVTYLREFLAVCTDNGPMRYHTRLILAKTLANQAGTEKDPENKEGLKEARELLLGAVADDWGRTDHWIWLGDLAFTGEKFEEALQFYLYASLGIGRPPFTLWWIDLSFYSYLPAQRLAMCYGELGDGPRALHWAKRVRELLPEGSPKACYDEAEQNIAILEEAIEHHE